MLSSTALATIKRHSMIRPGESICVALSGGPDSTALLHVLHSLKDKLEISLSACHVNHRLRGEESEEDARFSQKMAARLSVPIHIQSVDVLKYRRFKGGSVQTAARELRYIVFQRLITKNSANRIATAHTTDDNTETVLINFIRGSGPRGIAGIPAVREGKFIRPFLEVSKKEIFRYLERKNIGYRKDSSNDDIKYFRNMVRASLIPLLEKDFNPSLNETLKRTATIFGDIQDFLDKEAERAIRKIKIPPSDAGHLTLDCGMFESLPKALQREVIRKLLLEIRKKATDGISFENMESLRRLVLSNAGEISLPGIRAFVSHGRFYCGKAGFTSAAQFSYPWPSEGSILIRELDCRVYVEKADEPLPPFDGSCKTVYINQTAIPTDAVLRNRREGDRFRPLGGRGGQKLKQFFIDKKIPRWKRNSVLLLAAGSDVLWIAGYRLSEDIAVKPDARNVIKLAIKELY